MNMNYFSAEIDALDRRLHKDENREKYHNLVNHPSEVVNGRLYQEKIIKVFEIDAHLKEDERTDRDFLLAQLSFALREINEWLDKEGWIK